MVLSIRSCQFNIVNLTFYLQEAKKLSQRQAHCPPCGCCPICNDHRPECFQDCFPSSSVVNLDNGKSVRMAELKIGDRVQTGMESVTMSETFRGIEQTGLRVKK